MLTPFLFPPRERLLNDPTLRNLLHSYAGHFLVYVAKTLGMQDLLEPESALDRLNRELASCRDVERIRKLRIEIADVSAPKNAIKHRADVMAARTVLRQAYDPAGEDLRHILIWSVSSLRAWLAEARAVEEAWLAGFGLPREQTALSRRIEVELQKFKAKLASLNSAQASSADILPSIRSTLLDEFFGIALP